MISHALQRYQSQLDIQVKSKGKSILFDKYVNKKEEALEELAKKTDRALKYYDIYKKAHTSLSEEQHKNDPTF